MIRDFYFPAILLVFLFCSCCLSRAQTQEANPPITALDLGKTVQCDFTLAAYYKNRTPESIASEIEANGFDSIFYMVLDPQNIDETLLGQLHQRNISVWASLLATNVYGAKGDLPSEGKPWEMQFVNQAGKQYTHISFVHEGYRRCMKDRLLEMFQSHSFDGFLFMETHFPVIDASNNPTASFGDISPAFQEKFRQDTGNSHFPEFTDPEDPNYYLNNPELFEDLVQYRIKTVNEFQDTIFNGTGGLRAHFPGLLLGTWSMALHRENGLDYLRTWEAQDAASMVELVKPDVHFFQTHWPDWIRPDLPPDYAKLYQPFIDSVRNVDPAIPLGLQTDIGSLNSMRRQPAWVRNFLEHSNKAGFDVTTYYEFILRWEVYQSAPVLHKTIQCGPDCLKLVFDQVVAPESAQKLLHKKITDYGPEKGYTITGVNTDGNLVILSTDRPVESQGLLGFPVGGISDWPEVRFPINAQAQSSEEKYGPLNCIPKGQYAFSKPEKPGR
jgi:hypothetical protein